MSTTTGTGNKKTMYGSAEKKHRKSSGSGGVFSDSDTLLESPSSVATNATIISSDSGSEMELGHPSSSLLSASSTEAVVDTDHNDSASLACITATPHSVQGCSSTLSPVSLFPVPKVSIRQCCSSSTLSPASAQSNSPSSEHFSDPMISVRAFSLVHSP